MVLSACVCCSLDILAAAQQIPACWNLIGPNAGHGLIRQTTPFTSMTCFPCMGPHVLEAVAGKRHIIENRLTPAVSPLILLAQSTYDRSLDSMKISGMSSHLLLVQVRQAHHRIAKPPGSEFLPKFLQCQMFKCVPRAMPPVQILRNAFLRGGQVIS